MRSSSRRRVRVLVALAWAITAATASAQGVYYLRRGGVLALDPPPGTTAAVQAATLPAGGEALIGSFATSPLGGDVVADGVQAVLYLGTGRSGMEGCAHVSVTLSRLAGTATTAVAGGEITTTLGPRHQITAPVVVPVAAAQPPLAAAGERLVLAVTVANRCLEARTVSLLYDSSARSSRLETTPLAATTTTVVSGSTTSTTAIPASCLQTATGLAAVRCRLDLVAAMLDGTSRADLGGVRYASRLGRRIARASALVGAADVVQPAPRRLRRARRQLVRFARAVRRGRVAPAVGAPLGTLAREAAGTLAGLVSAS